MKFLNSYINKKFDKYLLEIMGTDTHDSCELSAISISLDSFLKRNFTSHENFFIWNVLNKKGFLKIDLPELLIDNLGNSLLRNINGLIFSDESIRAGYSIPITQYLSYRDFRILRDLGSFLCGQKSIKKYIFMPSIVGIEASYSIFSPSAYPTHAFLWHRDADCHLNQLKLMIPLVECEVENGMFSVMSKQACSRENILRDLDLLTGCEPILENDYRKSDYLYRISDNTARNSIKSEYIYDFKNKIGEALLVDTNNCYHKGGLVTVNGKFRLLIQITIGSFIHTWHDDKFYLIKNLRMSAKEYVVNKMPVKGVNNVFIG